MTDPTTRTIATEYLARVEGEGAMRVVVRDGAVEDVEFRIFEPPRYFEAFLRGRLYSDAPDITSRICGICPVAYQMSSVHALEQALRWRSAANCERYGGSCTAESGSKVTSSTSTCCTPPTSLTTRARSTWLKIIGRSWSGPSGSRRSATR